MSPTFETVQRILEQAVYAPSGDNSQPWRFVWQGSALQVYNIPDRDNPIFNFRQRGSYIAHGALLENIRLLASSMGLASSIHIFPATSRQNLVALVEFSLATPATEPLVEYICERCTNRKPYKTKPITESERAELFESVHIVPTMKLSLVDTRPEIGVLARAVSRAEQTMLEYQPLHDYFFKMVRWSAQEEVKTRSGLYVKTLELQAPQLAVFKLYSHWKAAQLLNWLGMSRFIAKENSKVYAQAGAYIAFTSTATDETKYIRTGQALQRLWLTATKLNLSLQPVGGVLYLQQRISEDNNINLTAKQQEVIAEANTNIHKAFNLPTGSILMLVRVGHGDLPTSHCSRMMPQIEVLD